MSEFCLSDKIILDIEGMSGIPTNDVKEFIREVLEGRFECVHDLKQFIINKAGERLI